MRALLRATNAWLAALGADSESQDVQQLALWVQPTVLYTADNELATEAVIPLSWSQRAVSIAVAARRSVVDIAATNTEVVVWACGVSAVCEVQQRHLTDDLDPIEANPLIQLGSYWLPRTSRAEQGAGFIPPIVRVGDRAGNYRPSGVPAVVGAAGFVVPGIMGPHRLRIARGMALTMVGTVDNIALTVDFTGNQVPQEPRPHNAARL